MSKIKQAFPKADMSLSKNSSGQKSRRQNAEIKLKPPKPEDLSSIQNQINIMNLGSKLKTPQFKIPRNKVQIKQQYLNRQFLNKKAGGKAKSQERKEKVNHSMIYDQVKDLIINSSIIE